MAHKVSISPYFYIVLPAALLLLPLQWFFAWSMAVAVHEIGHYLALRLCRVPIRRLEITPLGIRMHIGGLTNRETLVCALSGPAAGLLLIAASKIFPYTAVCAFIQGLFNLMPIYPLDGGRALRAAFLLLHFGDKTVRAMETAIFSAAILMIAYIIWRLQWGFAPVLLICGIFTQKFLANNRKSGYNRGENDF